MLKDQLDSKKVNWLMPLHELFFLISSKEYFICIISQVVEHWLDPEITQWVHHRQDST